MDDFISNVISNAKNLRKPGDYEKDGLLYCGKCNTPKQYRLRIGECKVKIVPCACVCANEEYEKKN